MVDFLWGVPLIVVILGPGLVLTIGQSSSSFAHLGLILKALCTRKRESGNKGV